MKILNLLKVGTVTHDGQYVLLVVVYGQLVICMNDLLK